MNKEYQCLNCIHNNLCIKDMENFCKNFELVSVSFEERDAI